MVLAQELKEKIIESLALEDITPDDIDANAPLFNEGLALDSVDALQIVILIEDEYGLEFENTEEAKKVLSSINNIVDFIQSK